jgi:hypothetical protein
MDCGRFCGPSSLQRDIEGLSTVQAAQVLNVSHIAAKAWLWRARLQLGERLNQYFIKQPESGRAELVSLSIRAGRVPDPLAENLASFDISA